MRAKKTNSIKAKKKVTPIKINTKILPTVPSKIKKSHRCSKLLILVSLIVCVAIAAAVGGIVTAIVLTQLQQSATSTITTGVTSTTGSNSTTISTIPSNSSSVGSTTVATTIGSTTVATTIGSTTVATTTGSTASAGSTTTGCPTNVCTYSTWYTMTSGGNYGVEHVNINCTQTLSNFTAQIVVKTNMGATFANEYNTFWSNTVIQTQTHSSSQITYIWSIIAGQTISGSGFPYFVEAQFQLYGQNQTVSNDTYSIQTVAACNGQVLTQTGHF
ncbi:unnamed protein product [Rotaria socialis]|uniref:Uncharacterized protein n=1 Tax=Rotaria socialis TaxID=392032 RepID=A0A817S4W7_9BILA|nr:unnamed protein product [Rotaria socialis]CAF4194988.1 unnamed protein product [Rotaria socialis]